MVNVLSWGAVVRLGMVGCGRGLLAAAVLLMSATAAVATGPTGGAEAGAETVEGEAGVRAAAASTPQLDELSLAELSLGLATELGPAPLQLASKPVAEVESAAMFRVEDLEAGLETDATVRPAADLAQVTRVTDFSDVSPADWAFQALSNLVETYNCLQGYPDGSFRGQRSMTRFEFAAGLNACLDVIAATLGGGIAEEDLTTLLRLQEDFAAELATLGGRVDQLEADTAQLRAQQFSTVTKLRGQSFFNIGTGFANGAILAERAVPGNIFVAGRDGANAPLTQIIDQSPGTPVGSVTWLNLDTSFTGTDRLKLQLTAGSGSGVGNFFGSAGLINTFGVPFAFQGGGVTGDYSVFVRELSYAFPLGNNLTVDIGPRINWYSYFDNNRYTFFLTGANSFNSSGGTQVNTLDRGTGAIAVWNVADWLDLRVGYLAENTEFIGGPKAPSDPSVGLFGGTSTLTGQIDLRPFDNLNLRFLYTRSNLIPNANGQIGGTFGEPIYGFADDGANGPLTNAPADTFLANFDWTPFNWLGLFGRYSYGSVALTSALTGAGIGNIDAQSIQFGLAFPNLLKEGALATVSYLVPFSVINGREFLLSGAGDGGRQQELEVSYRYPLNRNIALMPSVYWIMNANNFGSNPDIFIFNLQTQFSF